MCFSPSNNPPVPVSTSRSRIKTDISNESSSIQSLIAGATDLYKSNFAHNDENDQESELICAAAPGRVNLIGEHTDYTGGFVFPMAIDFSTVCVGTGSITAIDNSDEGNALGKCQIISANQETPETITFDSSFNMEPLPSDSPHFWVNYIIGVVAQYMDDFKPSKDGTSGGYSLSFQLAINGNVPLGSGLSSSASLEVSIATFIESLISKYGLDEKNVPIVDAKTKALRCQKAENEFCNSPCGIMDQYVSAAALPGSALLIDCRSLDYETVVMGCDKEETDNNDNSGENPVFVICNSNVKHSIGGGEYPIRVAQCKSATDVLRSIHGDRIVSLRDATLLDVNSSEGSQEDDGQSAMDQLIYNRAKHVVTENERTQTAKSALLGGKWDEFGKLMNESHQSMKTDYEVSCEEIDILVDLAQGFEGVYGSRLTGGGFGGCTVTLVEKSKVKSLCQFLANEYKSKTGKDCFCFETSPAAGSREIQL